MKVLFVSSVADMEGGAERSLLELAYALDAAGHACALALWRDGALRARFEEVGFTYVLDRRSGNPASPLGGATRHIPGAGPLARGLNWVRLAVRPISRETDWLAAVLQRYGADVAHTNCDLSVPVARAATETVGIPLVVHIRDHWRHWLHPRIAPAIRAADAVITPSSMMARRFRSGGVESIVVPNPVRGDRLARELGTGERCTLRRAVGATDGFAIAVLGRLDEQKGVLDLVEAATIAEGHDDPGVFVMAGRGHPRFERRVRRAIRAASVPRRFRMLGHRSDVEEWLPAMDALVAPSHHEPFGRMIVEGMLAALPVVAADDGAAPELIAHGRTGILVPAGDPAALAAAIRRLAADRAFADRLGETARREALDRFRPSVVAREVEAVYHSVLGAC